MGIFFLLFVLDFKLKFTVVRDLNSHDLNPLKFADSCFSPGYGQFCSTCP